MKKLFLFLIIVFIVPFAFAKELTLSLNQSEYYFLVGERAFIPLESENEYGKIINGMFTHTIVHEVNQTGAQQSTTNTQSQPFNIQNGYNIINVEFGSSDSPTTLTVSLSFDYFEEEEMTVELDEILIHFVSDESEKKQEQDRQETSSKKANQQSLKEQVKEKLKNMFKQEPQQQPQNKAQNNQMPQDSSALKEQMQQQIQEQKDLNQQFADELAKKEEFKKEHEELLNEGYKQSTTNMDAKNSTTGDFEVNYEKEGETAQIKGSMENGNITQMQKTTSESRKTMMEQLEQDPRFKEFNQELSEQNFSKLAADIQQQGNVTQVQIPYENERNETATIIATIEDNEIKDVKLEYDKKSYWWLWILIILSLAVITFLIYNKHFKKKPGEAEKKKPEKPINYRKEALKLLEKAKALFKNKQEKDAYGKASEAIRLYYSHKQGLKTELTNFELIKLLKDHKIPHEQTQKCCNLCGLVEFAKYKANETDFKEIIKLAEKIIT